ncbi:MAG: glycosyltransferase [Saprospiraceae bacterium]|nr:glycosyltransferase [Saprospiraceae bacterium]
MPSSLYYDIAFFFNYSILVYACTLMFIYIILGIVSIGAIRAHLKKRKSVNFDNLLRSPLAPKIAVIAPAYNESATIIENIRSLLSLRYNDFDIVIVNDGSKDDSLEKMIRAYDLIPAKRESFSNLPHAPIRAIYRSKNEAFRNLLVVDKENGGKADSLNAGINNTNAKYVANIDVDCIIEDDALLRMVEPFLQEIDVKMIATGGVVRIANDCEVRNGRIIKVNLPRNLLALFQTLEYLRAFLLGRMAWSRLNGLLIISGAFGLFDKSILIEAGGYKKETVGEDMELVVRMRRLMHERKERYKVHYIPDPLCWTESPTSIATLIRQRNRWTRGTIETLLDHRIMMFNPRFRILGLISYPFWLFFEWMAPLVEFFGLLYFLVLLVLGWVNWHYFLLLLTLVYSFAFMLSCFTILVKELTYKEYPGIKSILTLLGVALLEPILFHPIVVYSAIKGNWDKFVLRKSNWGSQVRKGFGSVKPKEQIPSIPIPKEQTVEI